MLLLSRSLRYKTINVFVACVSILSRVRLLCFPTSALFCPIQYRLTFSLPDISPLALYLIHLFSSTLCNKSFLFCTVQYLSSSLPCNIFFAACGFPQFLRHWQAGGRRGNIALETNRLTLASKCLDLDAFSQPLYILMLILPSALIFDFLYYWKKRPCRTTSACSPSIQILLES